MCPQLNLEMFVHILIIRLNAFISGYLQISIPLNKMETMSIIGLSNSPEVTDCLIDSII